MYEIVAYLVSLRANHWNAFAEMDRSLGAEQLGEGRWAVDRLNEMTVRIAHLMLSVEWKCDIVTNDDFDNVVGWKKWA